MTATSHPDAAPIEDPVDAVARIDTVEHARETAGVDQPYVELGLRDDEYERIKQFLGRRPTRSELAMYSIMWSEHCSYKSSKVHLRQFGEKAPPSDRLLAGIGENAGVVRISDDLAVTFKVESHNHPSFVEPHQGAATGIGGIVRDILAMGARPIAVMDPLRFGAADHEDTKRVLTGVVAGIGGYGNCLGLPNIGGEVVFDPSYQGNPLVNALCVGVLPVNRLQSKEAHGPGNAVVLLGAKTGRDGIGGVSVLASATFDDESHQRRPSVQVGDPFIEKLLIESCLELYERQLIVGVQDLGGAGLTCALTETSAAARTGMEINLDLVPLREPSMEPHEVLASESQERMLLIVEPDKLETVLRVADRWGVIATAIGKVSDTGRLVITWRDDVVVDVPPGSLVDDGPVYARPMREPGDLILLQADRAETLHRPRSGDELRETLLRLAASPNLCDKSWVTEQYDRYVQGNTVLSQPDDAGVVRVDEQSGLGIALSVDGNGRYARLDPYNGAKLALAEAFRNVATTGATPIAVTNCLNFGSPEDPAVMWQFAEAVRGLADGCAELNIPVTGGNVSFYNSTGAAAIHPTPVVGVLGLIEDVGARVPMGFGGDSDVIILLGETRDELGGSEWAWVTHGHLGGQPPRVNLVRERILAAVLTSAADHGHLSSAHDLSDGGLAQALVEACLRYNIGATMALPDESDPFVMLFAESTARALVSVPRGHERAFIALCADHGLPYTPLGVVDGRSHALDIRDLFRISLDEMRVAWSATMPALFSDAIPEVLGEPGPSASSESSDSAESPDSASAESVSPESSESSESSESESPSPESLSTVPPDSPSPESLPPEPSSPESPLPPESSASPAFFEHVEPPEVAEVAEVIESATGSSDATNSSDGAAADQAASATDGPGAVASSASGSPDAVASSASGSPDAVASASDGPDVVASASDGPSAVASASDGPDAVASASDGPDAVASASDGPDAVASASDGPDADRRPSADSDESSSSDT